MITRIQPWGNSQGLRLSKSLLEETGLAVGDEVDVAARDGAIVLTPARRVRGGHNLRDLVRRIRKGYTPGELKWGPPRGREAW